MNNMKFVDKKGNLVILTIKQGVKMGGPGTRTRKFICAEARRLGYKRPRFRPHNRPAERSPSHGHA